MPKNNRRTFLNIMVVMVAISVATALFLAQVKAEAIRQANLIHEQHIRAFWSLLRSKGKEVEIEGGRARIGSYPLNGNFELPDEIKSVFGGTATIFVGDVRVSTNVLNPDGSRAIGTRLTGPAYQRVIVEGKPYRGEALILGIPYFTAYDPIKDREGKVIGAIYVGEKKSEYLSAYNNLQFKVILIAIALNIVFSIIAFISTTEKRRSEKALHERERQKRAILNNIPDFAWLKDREGRFVAVNEAFGAACGLPPDEVVGKTSKDVWPEEMAFRYQACDREVLLSGERKQSDEPLLLKDGTLVWTEAVRTPIYDDQGKVIGLTGIARDITERRQTEKSLQDSEAMLREVFNNVNDGIILHGFDGTVTSFNDRALKMYGVESHEVPTLSIADLSAPDNDLEQIPILLAAVSRGESKLFEWKARRPKDGSVFDVQVFLNAIRLTDHDLVLATLTDITERKKNDAKMKHTLSVLSATLESTGDGIVILDSGKRTIRSNQRYRELMGLGDDSSGDVDYRRDLSRILEQVKNPESLTRDLAEEDSNSHLASHTVIKFKDGRVIERVSHPQVMDGAIVGRVVSYRDVTEQKKLEDQLRHAQKMEAVGTLTGGIAHDFNNILTVIIGCGTVMQSQLEESSRLRHYLEQILTAAEKAEGLTRGLLAYSRKQPLEPKVVDLSKIVQQMVKLLSRLIGEDVELETHLWNGVLNVLADIGQIEQVLMNLATNARDAMSGVGRLTIRTALLGEGSNSKLPEGFDGRPGPYALIAVSDTGKGIDEAGLERIFEPFYTTKEVGCGTGLGLSIVYGIIKQHGGHISVQSEPGSGTTFEIYLPLSDTKEQVRVSENPLPPTRGSETILLIEDCPQIRELFSEVLSNNGYRVLEAIDGEMGVEQFLKHQGEIDLLVIDVIMPKKNGRETLHEIRSIRKDVRAMFISGYTDEIIDRSNGVDADIILLPKPLAPKDLLEKVRYVLDN